MRLSSEKVIEPRATFVCANHQSSELSVSSISSCTTIVSRLFVKSIPRFAELTYFPYTPDMSTTDSAPQSPLS